MFIDWLSNKDLKDSDSLLFRGTAVVLFAGSVFVINELLFLHSSLLLLAGVSVIAGVIGFFVAKNFPIAIKAIPLVVVVSLAASGAKGLYEYFYFKTVFIEPFLAETENCKALGLELINKHTHAVCLSKDSKTIKQSCQHVRDNEWSCSVISWSDVIAEPNRNSKAAASSDIP